MGQNQSTEPTPTSSPSVTTTNMSFLRVEGEDIVRDGKPIILRGAATGGHLNQENFITGYAGHEHQIREALELVLGKDKADYYWDRFETYFFGEEDAKFFASLGLNCMRLPFNYRHVMDDSNPDVFKKDGLKQLDRVIDLCAKHGIYSVIDLHALPGGQNPDWHCDAGSAQNNFWRYKCFQDQTVMIWEELAKHYKDNTWVAGYNLINEPAVEQPSLLVAFYARLEKAIRAVDPHHILFLDLNTFGADATGFHVEDALPNAVYACHDYSRYGFPGEKYVASPEQKQKLVSQFERKIEFNRKIKGPIWNGEFGPVYAADGSEGAEEINKARYHLLRDQMEIYEKHHASFSIWLFKDVGLQGMTYVDPDTPYLKLFKDFIDKKKRLASDAWGADSAHLAPIFDPLNKWLVDNVPSIDKRYPNTWNGSRFVSRMIRECLMSEELAKEWAEHFRGKSKEELDDLAKSFAFEHCKQRKELNEILRRHSGKTVQ